jgi:hypothetical protein
MKNFLFILFAAAFLLNCNSRPGEKIIKLTDDGAWCWFSDPRAVYFEGKFRRIYSGWMDHEGNLVIGYYDLDSDSVKTRNLHPGLEKDDHCNPSILVTDEGRLMVFYSRHAAASPIYLQVSKNPEDIETWEERKDLYLNDSTRYLGLFNSYTYSNIFRLEAENNRLFLTWRGMDFKPNISSSADGGDTWSPGEIFILPERIYQNRRPYLKACSNNIDKIHFTFTDGHPNVEPANSVYYVCYQKGELRRANREKILNFDELPLDPARTDLVYDATTTGEKAWVWDIAQDLEENPVIAYVRFRGDSNHIYYYARWDGSRWQNYEMINSGGWFPQTPPGVKETEPNYSGGLVLDHEDPSTVYASVKRNGIFEIEKWNTPDGGKSWEVISVTCDSDHDNVRPFAIRNRLGEEFPQVLWLEVDRYVHYTDYRSSVMMN